jgi:hypothetical protein
MRWARRAMGDAGVGLGLVWGEGVGLLNAVTRPGLQFAGKGALTSLGQQCAKSISNSIL